MVKLIFTRFFYCVLCIIIVYKNLHLKIYIIIQDLMFCLSISYNSTIIWSKNLQFFFFLAKLKFFRILRRFYKVKGNRSNVEFDEWPRFRMQTFPINSRYFNLSYQSFIPKLLKIKESIWNCNNRNFILFLRWMKMDLHRRCN